MSGEQFFKDNIARLSRNPLRVPIDRHAHNLNQGLAEMAQQLDQVFHMLIQQQQESAQLRAALLALQARLP